MELKKNLKKIMFFLIITVMIVSLIPAVAFAAYVNPWKIYQSDGQTEATEGTDYSWGNGFINILQNGLIIRQEDHSLIAYDSIKLASTVTDITLEKVNMTAGANGLIVQNGCIETDSSATSPLTIRFKGDNILRSAQQTSAYGILGYAGINFDFIGDSASLEISCNHGPAAVVYKNGTTFSQFDHARINMTAASAVGEEFKPAVSAQIGGDCCIGTDSSTAASVAKIIGAKPTIVEQPKEAWKKEITDTFAFKSNMPFKYFKEVKVDDQSISSDCYTAWEGSTFVALKENYLTTLAPGKHTLAIISQDGDYEQAIATSDFYIADQSEKTTEQSVKRNDNVPTGITEQNNFAFWTALFCLMTAVLATVGVYFAHKKSRK